MFEASSRIDTSLMMDKQIESVWRYAQGCLGADMTTAMCNPFWTGIAVASVVIGVLILAWVASKLLGFRLAVRTGQNEALATAGANTPGNFTRKQQKIRAEIDEIAAGIREEIRRKK